MSSLSERSTRVSAGADLTEYAVDLLKEKPINQPTKKPNQMKNRLETEKNNRKQLGTRCVFGGRMLHAGWSTELAKHSAARLQYSSLLKRLEGQNCIKNHTGLLIYLLIFFVVKANNT